jgi:phosphoserine phosphatase RsbU/P
MESAISVSLAWQKAGKALGLVGLVCAVSLAMTFLAPAPIAPFAQVAVVITGTWLCVRWLRHLTRQAIWRLRNRLLVTYLFIAVVPLILILALVAVGAYFIANQIVVRLVSTELDHRVELIASTAERLKFLTPDQRAYAVQHMLDLMYKDRFQGIQVVVREGGRIVKYPEDESVVPPPPGWKDVSGILQHDGLFFGWAHRVTSGGDITIRAPFTRAYLANLVPDLGVADLVLAPEQGKGSDANRETLGPVKVRLTKRDNSPAPPLKPAAYRLDRPIDLISVIPFYKWDEPGGGEQAAQGDRALLTVRSRPSMIFDVLFTRKSDILGGLFYIAFLSVASLFLIVELVALFIGVSMTRTITSAVHMLYEGTQRVMEGDFTHRIHLKGRDQLAELGQSFNRMTENVEQLLAISKEKERMQSELEIASEVQNQLYPRAAPEMQRLKLRALCKPARTVSGDYYDFDSLGPTRMAIAIGDVAGKGISAALLMATLQSSVRTQLSYARDARTPVSTSQLVSHLNVQLYETTSPEKYCTFFLGVFDSTTDEFIYTNGGHLPPILFRKAAVKMLEVDGMVVGAFPHAEYGESRLRLEPGDLLLFYTDGITEPENAYGEMFGEERVVEVVKRNQHRPEDQILQALVDAVLAWTGSPELQDDMTLVIARCEPVVAGGSEAAATANVTVNV